MRISLQRTLFVVAGFLFTATAFSQNTQPQTKTVQVSECTANGWLWQSNGNNNDASISPNQTAGIKGSGKLHVGSITTGVSNGGSSSQTGGGNGNGNNNGNGGNNTSSPSTGGGNNKFAADFILDTLGGTSLANLTELKYSTFAAPGSAVHKAAILTIEISYSGVNTTDDRWIYDPNIQSTPSPVTPDTWQEWNAYTGGWYSTAGTAASSVATLKTLAELVAAQPNAKVVKSHAIHFTAGTLDNPWVGYDGNIDLIKVGTASLVTTYDIVCVAPTISCPIAPIVKASEPGQCGTFVEITAPAARNSCNTESLTPTGTRGDGKQLTDIFPGGNTTITWSVTDSYGTTTCTQTVTVTGDQKPQITCATPASFDRDNDKDRCSYKVNGTEFDATVIPGPCSTNVPVLSYQLSGATTSDWITASTLAGVTLNVGTTTITWKATDASGANSTCPISITVVDNQPPVLKGVTASPNVIWPPNHKMVEVKLNYQVDENCTYNPIVLSVTHDEDLNGLGDGNTEEDWKIDENDGSHVFIRAERSGLGNGRTYSIRVKVVDEAGLFSDEKTVTVFVPHDQSSSKTLDAAVGPNPSNGSFTVKTFTDNTKDKVSIIVSNSNGNVVYKRNDLVAGQTINFGEGLPKGTYFVELRQGGNTKKLILLKQ